MKGIYLIENQKTNEKYIGSSYKIHSRWGTHIKLLLGNKHHNKLLQKSFDNSNIKDFKFSILEIVNRNISDKELEEKETNWTLSFNTYINRLPLYKEGRTNFTHSRETIIQILKSRGKYRPIYSVDRDYNIIKSYEIIQDAVEDLSISKAVIYNSLRDKRFTLLGPAFCYQDEFNKDMYIFHPNECKKGKSLPYKGKRRPLDLYTIYGKYVNSFPDLYKCAEFLEADASNIHRKINILQSKKRLIDSKSSRYIVVDKGVSTKIIQNLWKEVFENIKKCEGTKYKVYDCFNNYLGKGDNIELARIIEVGHGSIQNSVSRGTYLRTLKFKKNEY